ncbi:MAG: tRNA pseudouridine(55) synthase TruB [Candidatus Doudnabacteria bacterium RIFCSPHIGHO2_01_FULL_49_9]|uniref:tRNA pseudouridine synthase B n=1 Tax=Candidatus Doudnabacteria bacterium RIFCSPHIGHO2_01_FULL_49_9 TaxID=1817827 RepID=A0A1F5P1I6_9BACT|nr:MAG: tRNA pseudouridine(55) synthase TruB [Candidatus Doudnabacteria bacterium RIFCSPHIGHO2_01_FULL_49_9]
MQGIFGIYKPVGPTSFGIVAELRKITGVKRIGHAGTLDPLAKGIIVVAIGAEYTKKIHEAVAAEKEYVAEIKLGETSATDDGEGEKTPVSDRKPEIAEIRETVSKFVGKIDQIPPIYSAIKISGKRAYDLARKGKYPIMSPRKVEIKNIEILDYSYPLLKLNVTTAKGVYIRSLARDIGSALGTGAYMSGLERTRVGEFTKANSLTLEEFASKFKY